MLINIIFSISIIILFTLSSIYIIWNYTNTKYIKKLKEETKIQRKIFKNTQKIISNKLKTDSKTMSKYKNKYK